MRNMWFVVDKPQAGLLSRTLRRFISFIGPIFDVIRIIYNQQRNDQAD